MSIPTQPTSPLISQSLSPPTCRKTDQSSAQQTDVKVTSCTKLSTPKTQVYAIFFLFILLIKYFILIISKYLHVQVQKSKQF